jgi:hypothetical protein
MLEMLGRINNGWALIKASWCLLMTDKRLLAFPVMSGVACVLAMLATALPIFYGSAGSACLAIFLVYFVLCFFVIFFNVAIIACAAELLRGREADLSFGLRRACQRLPQIVGWAMVAGTVGMILSAIEDRSSWVRSLLADLLGFAWALTSYLVIPVIALDGLGPIAALRESADLLEQTWGDQVVGGFGVDAVYGLLCIPGGLLIFAGIKYGRALPHPGALAGCCMIIGVAYLLILSVIHFALRAIFQAAVYLRVSDPADDLHGFPVALIDAGIQGAS